MSNQMVNLEQYHQDLEDEEQKTQGYQGKSLRSDSPMDSNINSAHQIQTESIYTNQEKKQEQNLIKDMMYDDMPDVVRIQKLLPCYIFNPYGLFIRCWNIVMIILLVYTGIVLPPRLAFDDETKIDWYYFDICIDSLFISDIFVNFFCAYEDSDGQLVYELKKIAQNYLTGWFAIDTSSSIPLYLFLKSDTSGSANYNNMLRLSKLPRIYKLAKVFRVVKLMKGGAMQKIFLFLKLNDEYTQILKFSVMTLVMIHTTGCFWYFLASFYPDKNWVMAFEINNESISNKYISSIYYILKVLVTVGYGNISPQNEGEQIFTIIFMFFAVMMYSYIMGVLTYQFTKLNEKVMQVKEREVYFNELASQYKIKIDMHEDLIKVVQSNAGSQQNKILYTFNNEPIFRELPPALVGDICIFMFRDLISQVKFFQKKPKDFLRRLFQMFEPVFLNPGDELYHKGEQPQEIYFVIQGKIVTEFLDNKGRWKSLVHIEGSYFGENDIIYQRDRIEQALAEDRCEVWKIDKEDFLNLLDDFDSIKKEFVKDANQKEILINKAKIQERVKYNPHNPFQIKSSYKKLNILAKKRLVEKLKDKDNIDLDVEELDEMLGLKKTLEGIKTQLGFLGDNYNTSIKDQELEDIIQQTHKMFQVQQKSKKV